MGLGPKAQQYPMHSAFWEGLWFLVENKDTGVKAGVCGNMNVNNQSAAWCKRYLLLSANPERLTRGLESFRVELFIRNTDFWEFSHF